MWFEVHYMVMDMLTGERSKDIRYFASLANAEMVADNLSACADVNDNVDVIDGTTGEVLACYNNGTQVF